MAGRMDRPKHRARLAGARRKGGPDHFDWPPVLAALLGEADALALDPRNLKPSELVRLLNSTPLGEVATERKLSRHRARAGYRIGEGKTLDLLRYTAWMLREVAAPRGGKASAAGADAYTNIREEARARSMALSRAGRDIGELPKVVNPRRKGRARRNFRYFCEQYFPEQFRLAWSADHLEVIATIERVVLEGGLFAVAMPRGSGKTTLAEIALMWAGCYGHRRFGVIIGPDAGHAEDCLDAVKMRFATNDLLLEDFPEICYPIRKLEGITQRAVGQLYNGELTRIEWSSERIVLPTIPKSAASGAIIQTTGITGGLRGMKFERADGQSVRPDLVLIDDPQTDESARSPSQCAERESIVAGAVLGLAGPGQKIAALAMVTVIKDADLADRLLDRKRYPQWQGKRMKLLYALPTNALWAEYAKVRTQSLVEHGDIRAATEFYVKHRDALDEGAKPAWLQRFNPDEASAVQHGMNLKLANEPAFWAEYQNEPSLGLPKPEETELTADEIASKVNRMERRLVPITATKLTMMVDVQGKALWWMVCAWEDDFTGYVVDYGTEPDQGATRYYTLRDLRRTLQDAAPKAGQEAQIYAGLERLMVYTVGREWKRDGGTVARIDRCLIDANWGDSTDVVYQFCRQSPHAALLTPSHGVGIGPASKPMHEYQRRPGERMGTNWLMPVPTKRAVRHVRFDTNWWKSFVHRRLEVSMGDPGCLSLFGQGPDEHRMLADHLTAEYRVKTTGRGREVDQWVIRVDNRDNHLLDGVVGCAVGASIEGCVPPGVPVLKVARKRLKLSDYAAKNRGIRR